MVDMRVSEVYASVQGEGPRTGSTTVFVRFGGCNLRCPGWPCDTVHAVDPAYRGEWERNSARDLAERSMRVADAAGARIITLTGGEPFLQHKDSLREFVERLRDRGYSLEAFTNGTIRYPEWATENVSMILDWKLPGSGEYRKLQHIRLANMYALDRSSIWHSVKFVCKDMFDLQQAVNDWVSLPEEWRRSFYWYYGRVWDGPITNAELVAAVMNMKLPWKLNVQLHNYIWPANERGR